jgi:hypothetical protein
VFSGVRGSPRTDVPAERLRGDRLWYAHLSLTSARLGWSVAPASSFLLGDDLASGRLVEVASPQPGQPLIRLGGYVLISRVRRWPDICGPNGCPRTLPAPPGRVCRLGTIDAPERLGDQLAILPRRERRATAFAPSTMAWEATTFFPASTASKRAA